MYNLRVTKYNRLELEAAHTALQTFIEICKDSCNMGKGCKICEYRTFCNDCFHLIEYIDRTLNCDNA